MRSLAFTQPSTTSDSSEVVDIAVPSPGPGQVSVAVSHSGINFIDVMARRGDPGYASSWPYAPGCEVSGVVAEIGSGVTGLARGQRVAALTTGGGLADVAIADAALVVPVPDSVAPLIAAAAPLTLATALLLLDDVARLHPGERLLMHSASGGIGNAVAQMATVLDAGLMIGTVGREDKLAAAEDNGWDVAIVRDNKLVDSVQSVAGGVDVVLDPTGTGLLGIDLEVAAPGARIVLFGNAAGGELAALPPVGQLIGANVAIAGFSMTRLSVAAPKRVSEALRRVLAMLAEGRLAPSATPVESLDAVPAVHDQLAEGRGTGKYVAVIGHQASGGPERPPGWNREC
jgi:NADPH:quinone reductase